MSLPARAPVKTESILPDVYAELRKIARNRMAVEPNHSISGTTLVHEAFIRLAKNHKDIPLVWDSRAHFFSATLNAMRRVIIDRARKKAAQKRGSNPTRAEESISEIADPGKDQRILAIDEALKKFRNVDPECAEIVTLKFYGGLTWKEIAGVMGVSEKTIKRRWTYAKSWLRVYLDL